VDGRNPAPVDIWFIPFLLGFQPSKVVQDFFHPQYLGRLPRYCFSPAAEIPEIPGADAAIPTDVIFGVVGWIQIASLWPMGYTFIDDIYIYGGYPKLYMGVIHKPYHLGMMVYKGLYHPYIWVNYNISLT